MIKHNQVKLLKYMYLTISGHSFLTDKPQLPILIHPLNCS